MAVEVIDKIKPKNGGSFPIVEAVDVEITDEVRLPEALAAKADASALAETNTAVAAKANASDVETATANLQSQIDNLITPVTQDAEVQNARVGIDGTSYITLKSRLDTEIGGLTTTTHNLERDYTVTKESLLGSAEITIDDISNFEKINGNCSTSGTWNNINSSYQFVIIPVNYHGGTIEITASSNDACYFCGLKTYTAPVDGAALNFSTAEGWTSKQTISAGNSISKTVPSDVGYILIWVTYSTDITPDSVLYHYAGTEGIIPEIQNNLELISAEITDVNETIIDIVGESPKTITDLTQYTPINGWSNNSKQWNNINSNYQFVVIPYSGLTTLSVTSNSSYALYIAALKTFTDPVLNASINYSAADGWTDKITVAKGTTKTYTLPSDASYFLIWLTMGGNNLFPTSFQLNIQGEEGRISRIEKEVNPYTVKWLALGDSITEGFYSIEGEGVEDAEVHKTDENYVHWAAIMKNFDVTNNGVGGCGWLKRGTQGSPKPNIRDQIDAMESGEYVIDFTQYDLVTVMLGVNDWKGSQNFGEFEEGPNPATESVIGNMRYFIETVFQRNPNIKIIVITPVNCRQDTSGRESTKANNWGIGFAFDGKTLEDYYDAIKEVCEYYDVEYIDMLHKSAIARENAETLLPDKVHPSLEAHKLMGLDLAGKITFGK